MAMFDLITGKTRHAPRHSAVPVLISIGAHLVVLGAVALLPILMVVEEVPRLPTMMAFVTALPDPPLPPPPPPPVGAIKPAARAPRPVDAVVPVVAPTDEPLAIEPEPVAAAVEEGVPGGVEGGMPGGVVAGIVGGLPNDAPAPLPPPPPPPVVAPPRGPVRVGGQVQAPALLRRVEPEYPWFAVNARIEGIVIVEATVDESGHVTNVLVLRSPSLALEKAAVDAVKQWQYSPLLLNGLQASFKLTVTLSFSLKDASGS
jgi:protein TonB